jgi:hypothetical protein
MVYPGEHNLPIDAKIPAWPITQTYSLAAEIDRLARRQAQPGRIRLLIIWLLNYAAELDKTAERRLPKIPTGLTRSALQAAALSAGSLQHRHRLPLSRFRSAALRCHQTSLVTAPASDRTAGLRLL